MQSLLIFIQKKLAEMSEYIRMAEKSLLNAPQNEHLRIVTRNGKRNGHRVQFFLVSDRHNPNGKYLKIKERNIAKQIARRDYDKKVLRRAKKFSKALNSFQKELLAYMKDPCSEVFSSNPAKRLLANPYISSDEEYRKNWELKSYKRKPFSENTPAIYTENGERVRSKSEKIIADKLTQLKIPYRYECPLRLETQERTIHPDFTLLDIKNRREIILEHFGLMDDVNYSQSAVKKINRYILEGFVPGENLLFTMETQDSPLDTRLLVKILENANLA